MRYLPLGDSYTIGTAVEPADRWPNQLAARLAALVLIDNPAVNGYTSRDLIERELPAVGALRPELVTVLIGVNDVVQGVAPAIYERNVATILDDLRGRLPADRIVCVATPDYTRTPRGAEYGDPDEQRSGILRVNELLRAASDERGIAFVPEIFPISERAATEPALVAEDGLHPSGAQYRLWADAIEPVIARLVDG